ncbi:MAG: hypothetical protein QOI66_5322 [Myxococcales bacterium]|nr:hypothetical protein [Myxococcales bacterium]
MRYLITCVVAAVFASVLSFVGCSASIDNGQHPPGTSGAAGSEAGAGGTAGTTAGSGGDSAGGSPGSGGAGVAGSGGDSGSGGAIRDGGSSDAVDAGFTEGDAGIGGPSRCAPGKYLICEDFESTAEGAVPTGWTKHGAAAVAVGDAARGTHALKISAAANGERRIYADATALGGGHWGRIFYKVQVPVPTVFVHSTLVALQGVGPTRGAEEVRVVDTVKDASGKHQFLYNVQPSGAEFGKGSAYNWTFDGKWHCAEWHIDGPTQSYHFYFDGTEVTSIALTNGPMKYAGTDIPPSFSQLRVGWNNYQSAPPGFVAWIDEVAVDTNRIGCGN